MSDEITTNFLSDLLTSLVQIRGRIERENEDINLEDLPKDRSNRGIEDLEQRIAEFISWRTNSYDKTGVQEFIKNIEEGKQ